jgi:hypothetical protein
MARLSLLMSTLDSFLNSSTRNFYKAKSKSSPPKEVSPLVDLTSNTPFEISRIDTSKVPPPKSKTAMIFPSALSWPKARAAAVGSLIILLTSRFAIFPAS